MRRVAFVLLLTLVFACKQPSVYEQFIPTSQANEDSFRFEVDMSDSTATYDIYFYTQVDRSYFRQPSSESLALNVRWTPASSGKVQLSEKVYLPLGGVRGTKEMYRSAVVPDSLGIWTIEARAIDAPQGLRGLGIICERNHGTR